VSLQLSGATFMHLQMLLDCGQQCPLCLPACLHILLAVLQSSRELQQQYIARHCLAAVLGMAAADDEEEVPEDVRLEAITFALLLLACCNPEETDDIGTRCMLLEFRMLMLMARARRVV
jgi:hypothetical protein